MRLAIETATGSCSVALLDGDDVIAALHENVGRGHAERLLPMIAALPQGGRADAILVDCGPGSFTGIRVGVAAARGLGLGWSVPVHGYSSLAVLAARHFASRASDYATIAIPGGHGEYFVQRFAAHPFGPVDALRSEAPAAMEAFADLVLFDPPLLEAQECILLPPEHAKLPPRPIYGRAPDAKPAFGNTTENVQGLTL